MRDTIEMAREAQMPYFWQSGEIAHLEQLKRFEALARADEREAWPVQPKPWVGLTDEERDAITVMRTAKWRNRFRNHAKAVEQLLKEKNHDQ
jgi:hypothetical protein